MTFSSPFGAGAKNLMHLLGLVCPVILDREESFSCGYFNHSQASKKPKMIVGDALERLR